MKRNTRRKCARISKPLETATMARNVDSLTARLTWFPSPFKPVSLTRRRRARRSTKSWTVRMDRDVISSTTSVQSRKSSRVSSTLANSHCSRVVLLWQQFNIRIVVKAIAMVGRNRSSSRLLLFLRLPDWQFSRVSRSAELLRKKKRVVLNKNYIVFEALIFLHCCYCSWKHKWYAIQCTTRTHIYTYKIKMSIPLEARLPTTHLALDHWKC